MKVPLNLLFEKMFNLGDNPTEEEIRAVIEALKENPEQEIDLQKFAGLESVDSSQVEEEVVE